MKKYIFLFLTTLSLLLVHPLLAQEPSKIDLSKITKAEIVKLGYDFLLDLPFEVLKKLAEIAGFTTDELLQLALNQEVSSASKKGESLFETPLSASVISKEEILLSGATTVEEALRLIPGLIVRQETNGNFDVHLRGNDNMPSGNMSHFSENTLSLVMIDNRIVYNYINGGTLWETLPVSLTDIERIEIVRGPSSALYGPNAVSGVINIITRKPIDEGIRSYIDIQAGEYNTKVANATILHRVNEKLQWKAFGNFDIRERFMTDYYEFLRQDYLPVDSLVSMFNNVYFAKSRDRRVAKDVKKIGSTFYFNPNAFTTFSVNMGMEESRAQSVFFENLATPLCIRNSNTGFIDLKAQVGSLSAQVNYLGGEQNLHEYMLKPVVHYDFSFVTGNIEYDWNLNRLNIGQLSIRPGINFQQAQYDDSKHISDYRQEYGNPNLGGLLNENKKLGTMSGNIRLDYRPISALRIVGAFRSDKFNIPDKRYFSYQGGISYLMGNNHMVRFVTSKAYRSPFMGDVYANYKNWLGVNAQTNLNIYQIYAGFESPENRFDYQLTSQVLYEIGYRGILSDAVQGDIEAFYTKKKDFTALMPRKSNEIRYNDLENRMEILSIWEYQNLKMVANQMGISGSLSIKPVKRMFIKVFGTVQQTKVSDYPITLVQDSLVNQTYKNTPSVYGGLTINYGLNEKWNLNASVYGYSEQTYSRYRFEASTTTHSSMSENIKAKAIVSVKISYNVKNNNTVFVNIRNLAPSYDPEFGFSDKIKPLILCGFNVAF